MARKRPKRIVKRVWIDPDTYNTDSYIKLTSRDEWDDVMNVNLKLADCHRSIVWHFAVDDGKGLKKLATIRKMLDMTESILKGEYDDTKKKAV